MKVTREILINELRDYALLVVVGSTMAAFGVVARSRPFNIDEAISLAGITSLVWIALWKGNSYLTDYLTVKISWIKFPVRRFIVGLVATVAYTILAVYLISLMYPVYRTNLQGTYITSVIITLVISLFLHARSFLINWKKTALEAEQYQRETASAQYEALKNQVSPHFLFNSLNALTNLVYEDKDKASKFVHQLSDVYKYVIASKDHAVVPLEEELAFLKSYLFLQQIRFGEKLIVNFVIESKNDVFIVPLALQMLIENAIKHNVVSEDDPLMITIEQRFDSVCVRNNLQKKSSIGSPSTGVGLDNIRKRYQSLGTKGIEIVANEIEFMVVLPLLTDEQINGYFDVKFKTKV